MDLCKYISRQSNFSSLIFHLLLSLTVEVEGPLAGDGAVEPRLEERGPLVAEFVRAARVVFAHAGHAGEDGLEGRKRQKKHEKEREGWIAARAH